MLHQALARLRPEADFSSASNALLRQSRTQSILLRTSAWRCSSSSMRARAAASSVSRAAMRSALPPSAGEVEALRERPAARFGASSSAARFPGACEDGWTASLFDRERGRSSRGAVGSAEWPADDWGSDAEPSTVLEPSPLLADFFRPEDRFEPSRLAIAPASLDRARPRHLKSSRPDSSRPDAPLQLPALQPLSSPDGLTQFHKVPYGGVFAVWIDPARRGKTGTTSLDTQ